MLSREENHRLTDVTRGTPMGELLRRYWMPIAAVAELDDAPTKPVRLLGEDLVLYKDGSGQYGLIDRQCPHRCADLASGMVEEHGLRCNYHGWLFDARGHCVAQPYEERHHPEGRFKQQIRIAAYPVQANAGLLWAYLGPAPAPELPNWRNFQKKGYKHVCFATVPCNWLQLMENAFDQVHNEWMHDKWSYYVRDGSVPPDRWELNRVIHREFDHGWVAEVEYVGHSEVFPDRVILWPNYSFIHLFEWYVPLDSRTTLLILWHNIAFRADAPYRQQRIPYWHALLKEPGTDRFLTRPPRNQDVLVWAGQGQIVDRTREHLGVSDSGIIALRKQLAEQMDIVQAGGDPRGVVRDPAEYFLMLPEPVPPGPERDGVPGAVATRGDHHEVMYLAGFPDAIREEIARVSAERGERALRIRELKDAGWKIGGASFSRDRHFAGMKRHGLRDQPGAPSPQ